MVAAPLQLGSGAPVMSIGGFSGSDQAITLAQFQAAMQGSGINVLPMTEGQTLVL